jgi:hypothetical protein
MLIFHICVNKYAFHRPAILFCKMHYTVLHEHNILRVFWRRTTKYDISRISGHSEKKFKYANDMYKTLTELQLANENYN